MSDSVKYILIFAAYASPHQMDEAPTSMSRNMMLRLNANERLNTNRACRKYLIQSYFGA